MDGAQGESHASAENKSLDKAKNLGITSELSLQLQRRELGAVLLLFAFILTSSNKLKITSSVAKTSRQSELSSQVQGFGRSALVACATSPHRPLTAAKEKSRNLIFHVD